MKYKSYYCYLDNDVPRYSEEQPEDFLERDHHRCIAALKLEHAKMSYQAWLSITGIKFKRG